ncbi:MAG: PTS sugar transporter subunit IIA [Candidatus Hatepunaea meridiana]|nr:PTS sugar transporter subunit IIA [Candidatus Hatepunaea meridiana]
MKLHELITPDHILLDLSVKNREDVIENMVNLLVEAKTLDNPDKVKKMVIDRERELGTGIGFDVAIPHAEPGPFPVPIAAFCRLAKGVNFNAPDKNPAHLIFLLLTPDRMPALHVRLMARICRLLKSKSLRKELLEAQNAQAAARIIAEAEADFPELNP